MTDGAKLVLEDGTTVAGKPFGAARPAAGEVVFTTGMVGYPESLTDPSFCGQILVFTYPLIGNYGVPGGDLRRLESDRIQVAGVVVARLAPFFSHAGSDRPLARWLEEAGVPGIEGADTRALTRHLRHAGTMLGKLLPDGGDLPWNDPNARNLLPEVSVAAPVERGSGRKTVVLVDFGCKRSIESALVARGLKVRRVPWDHPFDEEQASGFVLSNGPGDPRAAGPAIARTAKVLAGRRPVLGICLGLQVMALASGAKVYKLRFGHRGQNQPCVEVGGSRCFITSQNHGFAVDDATLGAGWKPWFKNGNDGSCEGILHASGRHLAVQFHPEARPGPTDTAFVFDRFTGLLDGS
jgi:carbamoyl-phosphate synthase small subunit